MFIENKYGIDNAVWLCTVNDKTVAYVPHDGHIPFISECPEGKLKAWIEELRIHFPKEEGWKFIPTESEEIKNIATKCLNNYKNAVSDLHIWSQIHDLQKDG